MFLPIFSGKWKQKQVTYTIKKRLCKCYKVYEDAMEFDTNRQKTQKAQKN